MENLSSYLLPSGNGHWISDISLVLGFVLSSALFVGICRLTFHPLAKYPGPLLSKLSGWPTFWEARSGNRHMETWKQHEIYGPIVRIGPNAVSINTISGLKAIYGSRKCNVQKSNWYATVAAAVGDFSLHTLVDRQRHAFRRRVLEHAFTETALSSAEKFIHSHVQAWCKHLARGASKVGKWSSAKNMSDWSTYLGYDIMGSLAYGKDFRCMESDEHRYVPDLMMRTAEMVYVLGYTPISSILRPILRSPLMGLVADSESMEFIKYADKQMAARIAAETERPGSTQKDFAHYLINAKDSETGQGFSTAELYADSSLLISAGSDTTAITLAATFFYLLHNPETLTKLTDEIRTSFSSSDQMNSKTLSNLPYLRACIDESLRTSPPVASHLPREVLPGGLTIDENYFPAGTVVGTSAYAIHHNKEYYPDPFAYRPERWIIDPAASTSDNDLRSPETVAKARAAFCAFSHGPRGCIGKRVAYNELSNTIGTLLFSYDMRLSPGTEGVGGGNPGDGHWGRRRVDEFQLRDFFLPYRDGPKVEFKSRE